jgi:hydrogenase maturation protease
MNPIGVLRMAQAMNIDVKNILLIGCEPETLGGEDGQMGLSAPMEAAVDEAVKLVRSVVDRVLTSNPSGFRLGAKL